MVNIMNKFRFECYISCYSMCALTEVMSMQCGIKVWSMWDKWVMNVGQMGDEMNG